MSLSEDSRALHSVRRSLHSEFWSYPTDEVEKLFSRIAFHHNDPKEEPFFFEKAVLEESTQFRAKRGQEVPQTPAKAAGEDNS